MSCGHIPVALLIATIGKERQTKTVHNYHLVLAFQREAVVLNNMTFRGVFVDRFSEDIAILHLMKTIL